MKNFKRLTAWILGQVQVADVCSFSFMFVEQRRGQVFFLRVIMSILLYTWS